MNTTTIEQPYMGSLTLPCMLGDITICWDAHNREQILELIRKKMKEGYSFFTTKKFMFSKLTRKVKITEKNIDVTEEIIITDQQFEKMIVDMNDKDIATLVRQDEAMVVKRKHRTKIETLKKATKAEDVIDKDSVAFRPLVGG